MLSGLFTGPATSSGAARPPANIERAPKLHPTVPLGEPCPAYRWRQTGSGDDTAHRASMSLTVQRKCIRKSDYHFYLELTTKGNLAVMLAMAYAKASSGNGRGLAAREQRLAILMGAISGRPRGYIIMFDWLAPVFSHICAEGCHHCGIMWSQTTSRLGEKMTRTDVICLLYDVMHVNVFTVQVFVEWN